MYPTQLLLFGWVCNRCSAVLYAGTVSNLTPATSADSPGLIGLTFPSSFSATSRGATNWVVFLRIFAMSSGSK